jgi:ribosomal protein L3
MFYSSNSALALKRDFTELHSFVGLNRFIGEVESHINLGINFENEFKKAEKVSLIGKKIGRGFLGNRKKNGFTRGPMTHGSKNHRLPGSIGASASPSRVLPGKKNGRSFKIMLPKIRKG